MQYGSWALAAGVVCFSLFGCGASGTHPVDGSPTPSSSESPTPTTTPPVNRCEPQPVTERLWPVPGELFYAQIGLGGFALGESAVVVGPTGQIVVIDVGNDSHDDDVRAFLDDLVAHMNDTPGFPPRTDSSVDYVILTHFHADHVDGLEQLLQTTPVTGRVIHRGFYDVTGAAGESSVEKTCDALDARPGLELALCTGAVRAPCAASSWTGTYPSAGCPVLGQGDVLDDSGTGPAYLALGDARIELLGVNGEMDAHRYEVEVGGLLDTDSNGENARSVVGMIRHGELRFLFNGDLTGGGSVTDPVEGYYVPLLPSVTDVDGGIDVLHAGHHGRNTSTSAAWADALLPADGRVRNVVMGISTAHAGSPHSEVVDELLTSGRLSGGRAWTTRIAPGGTSHADLVNASGGLILLRTTGGGGAYVLQAVSDTGVPLETESYASVGCVPPSPGRL